MNPQRTKLPAKIEKIILFNQAWVQKEGEEVNKLIFYYNGDLKGEEFSNWENSLVIDDVNQSPTFESDEEAIKDATNSMGLSEAMINFVKNFGSQEEIYSVHGSKIRMSLKEIEPDFWLSLCLTLPKTLVAQSSKESSAHKDQHYIEYQDDELNDYLVQTVMKQIYESFFLFHGSLQSIWEKSGKNLSHLRSVCSGFFGWFLPSLKFSMINLIELFGGIQYLSVDQSTYMAAQSFVNHVLSCDLSCKHILFLFNEQLISSSLDLNNTRIIYRYLISSVIPEVSSEEMSEPFRTKVLKKTRFIRTNIKVYLKEEESTSVYLMNVYRSINGATVAILLDSTENPLYDQILSKCDVFMSERLPELAFKLGEIAVIGINSLENSTITSSNSLSVSSVSTSSSNLKNDLQIDSFRFAYFNESNASFKSNAGFNGRFDHRKQSDSDFIKLIIDVKSDLRTYLLPSEGKNFIEFVAKTTNESWLVAHETDARTLFCMLHHKNDNLVEAAESVATHLSKRFKNYLFLD